MSKKIILASSSPRRKELLTLAGVPFEIKIPDVDESLVIGEAPKAMVKRLSLEKAIEVWRNFLGAKDSALVLAADTTVVNFRNEILGKPRNKKEAMEMIESLQGQAHRVYTGFAIVEILKGELRRKKTATVETKVFIRALDASEVKAYVGRGESLDKAGGYAAQGFGMTIIERIDGSYTNVVGLPMAEVLDVLKSFGWKP
jgi:septum formation protein